MPTKKPATVNPAAAAAASAILLAPQKPTAGTKPRGQAGAKVFVFNKMPMAIELQLCEERMSQIRYKQEVWHEPVFVRTGKIVVAAGSNYPIGAPPPDVIWPERPTIVAGYAVTPGVDKEFWDAWVKQNAEAPMVKSKLIFAAEKLEDGRAIARENKSLFTGLGPLERGRDAQGNETITDPRQPKKVGGGQQIQRPAADADDDYAAAG